MITTNSPIRGNGGTLQEAVSHLMEPDAEDVAYASVLFSMCMQTRVDYRIAFAQFCVETADGTSERWRANRNPAGLAVTRDSDPDPATFTGAEAARVHVWALEWATLIEGSDVYGVLLPDSAGPFRTRWKAKFADPNCPTVATVADLCRHYTDAKREQQATWAWDPTYADQIVRKANAIFKEDSVESLIMTKGLIPLPPIVNRLIPDANTSAWDDLGQRTVKGFVLHRMLGSLDGTDAYFRNDGGDKGLTDYGQDAVSGKVYQWNDPLGLAHPGVSPNRAGWASGVFNVHGDAYGDGLAFEQKYGLNGINRDEVSWEISGQYGDPWSEAAMDVAAQACAHYAHDYGIPYDRFPIAPQDGFSFVHWHQEITGPAEKICPGPVVMQQTPQFIQKVQAIMQKAQTGTASPQPSEKPPAIPTVPWKLTDVGLHKLGDVNALAFLGEVTAKRDVPIKLNASKGAQEIGRLKKGETAVIRGTFRSGASRVALIDLGAKGIGRASLSAFAEHWPLP